MPAKIPMIGKTFGRLTVIEPAGTRHKSFLYSCLCTCGTVVIQLVGALRNGHVRSCGCLQRESAAKTSRERRNPRGRGTPEYKAWQGMKERCHNTNDANYKNYGARGITVWDGWRNDFSAFLADVGTRPGPDCSLDRIDNEQGYKPGNCRWATRAQQTRNTRQNAWVDFQGKRMVLFDACQASGVKYTTAVHRRYAGKNWLTGETAP